jgi:hypothetical protein
MFDRCSLDEGVEVGKAEEVEEGGRGGRRRKEHEANFLLGFRDLLVRSSTNGR